ncbi:MAG: SPOR domain-containing protein [Steroidobacterales bacterium]
MVTFQGARVARAAFIAAVAVLAAGCSREQQDWRSAESAGTSEAFSVFIEQHPQSELVRQAHERIAQFAEARDWQQASATATLQAYQKFLARHPTGHWSETARIRIEGFALGSAPRIAEPPGEASPLQGATGVRLMQLAAASAAARDQAAADSASASSGSTSVPPEVTQTAATLRRAVATQAAPVSAGMIATASVDNYSVQLGAFGSEATAGAEWDRLQTRFGTELGGLEPRIVAASTPGGRLYRLQASTDDEAQARAICASLKQQWQACMAVPARPQGRN